MTPISLTPFGRLVLERTEPILMQIHQLGREVDLMRGIAVGELTVGASPIPSDSLVGPCLGKLLGEYPGLRAKLQTKPWTELVVDLRRGELELFVAEGRRLMDDDDLRVDQCDAGVDACVFEARSAQCIALCLAWIRRNALGLLSPTRCATTQPAPPALPHNIDDNPASSSRGPPQVFDTT